MLEYEGEGDDWGVSSDESSNLCRANSGSIKIKINDYVIVQYEEEFFPGLVLNTKGSAALFKVLLMSGSGWKWPRVEDKLWYNSADILEKISPPKYDSKQQIYKVEEIEKYRVKST